MLRVWRRCSSQYDYFPTIENVDNVQIVFGKHIGSGNVIFFGDVEPAWNNGSPNYYQAVNLLGNIILLNVNDSSKMGCTDILACNFNISSLIDDGSCIYPDLGYDCDGNVADIEESQNNFNESEVVNEINLFLQSLNSNLVAYYPFNGNANDESGNENHQI